MLFETNILSIEAQTKLLTTKLLKSISFSSGTPILQIVRKCKTSKKVPRIPSAIFRSIDYCKKLDLPIDIVKTTTKPHPPWHLDNNTINTSLHFYLKSTCSPSQYQSLFNELRNNLYGYTFIFTDGSKCDDFTSFSITTENCIIKFAILPIFTTVYSAELIAVYEAIKYVWHNNGKFAICSDSLSTLLSIGNINIIDHYISEIRNILVQRQPDIKLVWLPGHCGIKGNEFADKIAKSASIFPLFTLPNYNYKDWESFILLRLAKEYRENLIGTTSFWYRNLNHEMTDVRSFLRNLSLNFNRTDIIKFERLRLGHSKLTHGHLMNLPTSQNCNCSSPILNPSHILQHCSQFTNIRNIIFGTSDPIRALSNPSSDNIKKIINFLKASHTYNCI